MRHQVSAFIFTHGPFYRDTILLQWGSPTSSFSLVTSAENLFPNPSTFWGAGIRTPASFLEDAFTALSRPESEGFICTMPDVAG